MVRIVELDDRYRAYYFEDAEPIPKDKVDKALKTFPDGALRQGYLYVDRWGSDGYIVVVGTKNGHFVPKYTDYSKDMYDLDTVMKLAKNIDKCGICRTLDKNVGKIERIDLLENKEENGENKVKSKKPSSFLKDAFSSLFFDILLTKEGKFFLGALLDDEELLDEALPENEEEMYEFIANLADFLMGKKSIVRSPSDLAFISETARKKAETIRKMKEGGEDEKGGEKEEKKRKPVMIL